MCAARYCPARKIDHDPMINASGECAAILRVMPELADFSCWRTCARILPDIA
jgi:hypothetical protein